MPRMHQWFGWSSCIPNTEKKLPGPRHNWCLLHSTVDACRVPRVIEKGAVASIVHMAQQIAVRRSDFTWQCDIAPSNVSALGVWRCMSFHLQWMTRSHERFVSIDSGLALLSIDAVPWCGLTTSCNSQLLCMNDYEPLISYNIIYQHFRHFFKLPYLFFKHVRRVHCQE